MATAPKRGVFTHSGDIARGLELATDHSLDRIYNLGTGEAYDFNTVVEMINKELGAGVEPEYVESPILGSIYVHYIYADCSKIHADTGWKPTIGFEEGITGLCAISADLNAVVP